MAETRPFLVLFFLLLLLFRPGNETSSDPKLPFVLEMEPREIFSKPVNASVELVNPCSAVQGFSIANHNSHVDHSLLVAPYIPLSADTESTVMQLVQRATQIPVLLQ